MLNYPPTHSCYLKLFYNLTDPTITLTLAFREAILREKCIFLTLFKKPLTLSPFSRSFCTFGAISLTDFVEFALTSYT